MARCHPRCWLRWVVFVIVCLFTFGQTEGEVASSNLTLDFQHFSSLEQLCSTYGEKARSKQANQTRVYDTFIFNHEEDMALIRLRTLQDVVDGFIVVESNLTFRDTPKPLLFPMVYRHLPAALINKIQYVVLDHLVVGNGGAKELFMRDQLFDLGIPVSRFNPQPDDVVMVSDVDEIPRASFVYAMKHCTIKFPARMSSDLCYYSFTQVAPNKWLQPVALTYNQTRSVSAANARANAMGGIGTATIYDDSAWHCSYCFDRVSAFQHKLHSSSEPQFDRPEFTSVEGIVHRVRNGLDVFNRAMTLRYNPSAPIPAIVQAHPARFAYLLNRTGPDAGFLDL